MFKTILSRLTFWAALRAGSETIPFWYDKTTGRHAAADSYSIFTDQVAVRWGSFGGADFPPYPTMPREEYLTLGLLRLEMQDTNGNTGDMYQKAVAALYAPQPATTHRVVGKSPALGMSYGGQQRARLHGAGEDDDKIAVWPDGDWTWLIEVEQGSWNWKSDDYQIMAYGAYVEQQARHAVEGVDHE